MQFQVRWKSAWWFRYGFGRGRGSRGLFRRKMSEFVWKDWFKLTNMLGPYRQWDEISTPPLPTTSPSVVVHLVDTCSDRHTDTEYCPYGFFIVSPRYLGRIPGSHLKTTSHQYFIHSIIRYVHSSVTSQSLRTYEPNLVPRRTNVISPRLSHITKRPLGRPRCRWEDNIKLDLQKVGWAGMDWIYLAQDRGGWWAIVNAVMNLRVP